MEKINFYLAPFFLLSHSFLIKIAKVEVHSVRKLFFLSLCFCFARPFLCLEDTCEEFIFPLRFICLMDMEFPFFCFRVFN